MRSRSLLLAAALIALPTVVLAQGAPTPLPPSAQEQHPIPVVKLANPTAAPFSPAHQQALLGAVPGQCGKIAAQALDNVGLRIQQNLPGTEPRISVISNLQAAIAAQEEGSEDSCWHWYDRAQQVVR